MLLVLVEYTIVVNVDISRKKKSASDKDGATGLQVRGRAVFHLKNKIKTLFYNYGIVRIINYTNIDLERHKTSGGE